MISDLYRSANALGTITRLVTNSLEEPDGTGATPLATEQCIGLLEGAEIIAKHLHGLAVEMNRTADQVKVHLEIH